MIWDSQVIPFRLVKSLYGVDVVCCNSYEALLLILACMQPYLSVSVSYSTTHGLTELVDGG